MKNSAPIARFIISVHSSHKVEFRNVLFLINIKTLDPSLRGILSFDYNFGSIWFYKALFILICIGTLITITTRGAGAHCWGSTSSHRKVKCVLM